MSVEFKKAPECDAGLPALAQRHAFKMAVAGINLAGPYEDVLHEAGCDDATVVVRDGVMYLDFDREAPAFSDAVGSATHDVEKAGGRVLTITKD